MEKPKIRLRTVDKDDMERVFLWVNDPMIRGASFDSDPIPFEAHKKWFSQKIIDPNCRFFIGLNGQNEPVGQVRFEKGTLSFSIAPEYRGKGYGTALVQAGVQEFLREFPDGTVYAYAKPENTASIKILEKTGFQREKETVYKDQPALYFTLKTGMISA